jgi:hypothetical protein
MRRRPSKLQRPRTVFRVLEGWWGESIRPWSAPWIANAPERQLDELAELWPTFFEVSDPLRDGALRPIIHPPTDRDLRISGAPSDQIEVSNALHTLLYAPQIVMDRGFLYPLVGLNFSVLRQTADPRDELHIRIAHVMAERDELVRGRHQLFWEMQAINDSGLFRRSLAALERRDKIAGALKHLDREVARQDDKIATLTVRMMDWNQPAQPRNPAEHSAAPVGVMESRRLLEHRLRLLIALRPFIEDESILFAKVRHDPAEGFLYAYELATQIGGDETLWEGAGIREHLDHGLLEGDPSTIGRVARLGTQLGGTVELARKRLATPLARNAIEEVAWSRLIAGHRIDERVTSLQKLSRIQLPQFRPDTKLLVRLRSSHSTFAVWREALTRAVQHIASMPVDAEVAAATEIVSDELGNSIRSIRIATEAPALAGLREGTLNFVLSGLLGAGIGLASGQPLTGVAAGLGGSAASGAAQGVQSYLHEAGRSKAGRLLWDVYVGMFPRD